MAKNAYFFNGMSFIPNNQHPAMDMIVGKRNSVNYSRIPRYVGTGKSRDFQQTVVGIEQQSKSYHTKDKCSAGKLRSARPAEKSYCEKNSENARVSKNGSKYFNKKKENKSDRNLTFKKLNARISKHIGRWMTEVDKQINSISIEGEYPRQHRELVRITSEIKKHFTVVLDKMDKFPQLIERKSEKPGRRGPKSGLDDNLQSRHRNNITNEVDQTSRTVKPCNRRRFSNKNQRDAKDSAVSTRSDGQAIRAKYTKGNKSKCDAEIGVKVEKTPKFQSKSMFGMSRKVTDGRREFYQHKIYTNILEDTAGNSASKSHRMSNENGSFEFTDRNFLSDGDYAKNNTEYSTYENQSERFYSKDSLECSTKASSSIGSFETDSLECFTKASSSVETFETDSLECSTKVPLSVGNFSADSLDNSARVHSVNQSFDKHSLDCSINAIFSEKSYVADSIGCYEKRSTSNCETMINTSLNCLEYSDKLSTLTYDESERSTTSSTHYRESSHGASTVTLVSWSEKVSSPSCLKTIERPAIMENYSDRLQVNDEYESTIYGTSTGTLISECKSVPRSKCSGTFTKLFGDRLQDRFEPVLSIYASSSETLTSENEPIIGTENVERPGNATFTKIDGGRLIKKGKATSSLSQCINNFEDNLVSSGSFDDSSVWRDSESVSGGSSKTPISYSENHSGRDSSDQNDGLTFTKVNGERMIKKGKTSSSLSQSIYKFDDNFVASGSFDDSSVWRDSDSVSGGSTKTPISYSENHSGRDSSDQDVGLTFTKVNGGRMICRGKASSSLSESIYIFEDNSADSGSFDDSSVWRDSESVYGGSTKTMISHSEDHSGTGRSAQFERPTFTKLYDDRLYDKIEPVLSRYAASSETMISDSKSISGTDALEDLGGSTFTILKGSRLMESGETRSSFSESINEKNNLEDSGTFTDLSVWLESDTDQRSPLYETSTDTLTSDSYSL